MMFTCAQCEGTLSECDITSCQDKVPTYWNVDGRPVNELLVRRGNASQPYMVEYSKLEFVNGVEGSAICHEYLASVLEEVVQVGVDFSTWTLHL